MGPTERWALDQQTPPLKPSYISEDCIFIIPTGASALPTEAPEEMEPFPTPQEAPALQPEDPEEPQLSLYCPLSFLNLLVYCGILDQHSTSSESVSSSIQQKSSALLQFPLAGLEPSVRQKGPARPPDSSVTHDPTVSPLDLGAQHSVLQEHDMEEGGFWKAAALVLGCLLASIAHKKCGTEADTSDEDEALTKRRRVEPPRQQPRMVPQARLLKRWVRK